MDKFLLWFASSPIASFLRVAFSIVLFMAVNDFVKFGEFNFENAESWFIAGIASGIPTVLRWLNPEDMSFGKGG